MRWSQAVSRTASQPNSMAHSYSSVAAPIFLRFGTQANFDIDGWSQNDPCVGPSNQALPEITISLHGPGFDVAGDISDYALPPAFPDSGAEASHCQQDLGFCMFQEYMKNSARIPLADLCADAGGAALEDAETLRITISADELTGVYLDNLEFQRNPRDAVAACTCTE